MITPTRGVDFFLPATAYIVTDTFTSDSGGGATTVRGTAGTVACRIDALGGSEAQVAGRISDRSTHLVTLPAETSITAGNDLSIDGSSFEVTAVRDHTDELVRHVEVVSAS